MPRAIWNDIVIAEADDAAVKTVEGNVYFPPGSIRADFFKPSETHSVCSCKGTASYYTLEADGKKTADAAWYYPEPKPDAESIRGHIAFWKGVRVE